MIDYREPFEANSRGASTSEHRENGKSPAVHKDKDPIRIYLKEMGMVSLLDREGEVKVAQRIEKGQKKVMEALSRSPAGMAELLGLGRQLKQGELDQVGEHCRAGSERRRFGGATPGRLEALSKDFKAGNRSLEDSEKPESNQAGQPQKHRAILRLGRQL